MRVVHSACDSKKVAGSGRQGFTALRIQSCCPSVVLSRMSKGVWCVRPILPAQIPSQPAEAVPSRSRPSKAGCRQTDKCVVKWGYARAATRNRKWGRFHSCREKRLRWGSRKERDHGPGTDHHLVGFLIVAGPVPVRTNPGSCSEEPSRAGGRQGGS